MSRTMFAFLLVLALFSAAPSRAADPDEEARRIRNRMESVAEEQIERLIAEQYERADKADAALVFGAMFETGRVKTNNPLLPFEYYKLSAEYGCAEADVALANSYYNGLEGLPRDVEKAIEYYEKAAAGGSGAAMLQLGVIYADGMGVEPDGKKAIPYFLDAAARGDTEALRRLEPVMRQAKEWEEAKPGRKANFPTTRDQIVKPELVKQQENRNAKLDRLASRLYVELNKRIAAAVKGEIPSFPAIE